MSDKKLTQDQARLFSFVQIGACLNQGLLSEADATAILLARAQRKATDKGVSVNSDGSVKA
jgi:hypothetical protein